MVVLLGVWAGLIPFVGPYFDFGFTPDQTWHYSSSRLWLSILPAAVAVVGGLMMIFASRRPSGALGAWLGIAAGVWLIVGPSLSLLWQTRAGIGTPLGGIHRHAIEWVGCFYGVGAAIVGFAAFAAGRFWSRPHVAEEQESIPAQRRRAAPAATPGSTERRRTADQEPAAREPAAAGPGAPSATDRRREPEAADTESTTAGAAEPSATDGRRAEREPADRTSPGGPRTGGPADADDQEPAERGPGTRVRLRRRQGGLVGRLLGRRSG